MVEEGEQHGRPPSSAKKPTCICPQHIVVEPKGLNEARKACARGAPNPLPRRSCWGLSSSPSLLPWGQLLCCLVQHWGLPGPDQEELGAESMAELLVGAEPHQMMWWWWGQPLLLLA